MVAVPVRSPPEEAREAARFEQPLGATPGTRSSSGSCVVEMSMDFNDSQIPATTISADAVPLASTLVTACATDKRAQDRVLALIRAILRGETLDARGLSASIVAAIPQLKQLNRSSLEMVGYCLGDVDGDTNNHPYFVVIYRLGAALDAATITVVEAQRLIEHFGQTPGASIPTDLSPVGRDLAALVQLLPADRLRQLEHWFFPDEFDPNADEAEE